ncbi:hypothetical protein [Clostridium estertheticum]|uniref:hypothetical protein n=1 Tax=Clostridium estertheticum TaxID=238834 RepID=UPI001C0DF118|nr:hypothetical protein [Clostridium estertheticum]MBU3186587.1 hypothetical protein [Clostridium estertheticum]
MDTTNKHIGNVLSRLSDEDMKEVLEQYIQKCGFNVNSMCDHFQNVIGCNEFDYEGNIKIKYKFR